MWQKRQEETKQKEEWKWKMTAEEVWKSEWEEMIAKLQKEKEELAQKLWEWE